MGDSESLADAAYRVLRARIVECVLEPGAAITERGLAQSTGFGLTPVREALRRLRFEGLVDAIPRAGYVVSAITVKDVDEVFEVWRAIGPALMALAVPRLVSEQLEAVSVISEATERWTSQSASATSEWMEHSLDLFEIMLVAANNRRLAEAYRRLEADLQRIFTLVLRDPATVARFEPNEFHLPAAVLTRDPDAVVAEMKRSIAIFYSIIRDHLFGSASVQQALLIGG